MSTMEQFLIAWFGFTNAIAFVLYGYDKLRAGRAGDRVPERHLLAVAAMGGWPGALLVFRHKTRKVSFQIKFAFMFVVWAAVAYACWTMIR
jgi:uncharacterized membrane protein YsdA (DUF1294 family)